MRNDWILDVLADLRVFAQANDLPLLAEQLDDTALIATAEFAAKSERSAKHGLAGEDGPAGGDPVRIGAGGQP